MEERERTQSDSKQQAAGVCSSGEDDAEKADVCSDRFDPLFALYSPAVSLPFPNVKCFNNVAEYESFLKGGRGRAKPQNVEKKRLKALKGAADPERIERLKRLMVNNPLPETEEGEAGRSGGAVRGRRRQKPQKNVLTRMPLCKGSPLGELYRCVEERIRVKVHIRTFKGLRGVCSGFVVAFDKFWNMALVDVDETYREPLLGEAFYHEKALTISRLFDKLSLQESSGGDEKTQKHEVQTQVSERKPVNPKASRLTMRRADDRTQPTLSDAVHTKQDKVLEKAQNPGACKKNDSQTYGKVHTRHINQLFIRGESVILVNPQPL